MTRHINLDIGFKVFLGLVRIQTYCALVSINRHACLISHSYLFKWFGDSGGHVRTLSPACLNFVHGAIFIGVIS